MQKLTDFRHVNLEMWNVAEHLSPYAGSDYIGQKLADKIVLLNDTLPKLPQHASLKINHQNGFVFPRLSTSRMQSIQSRLVHDLERDALALAYEELQIHAPSKTDPTVFTALAPTVDSVTMKLLCRPKAGVSFPVWGFKIALLHSVYADRVAYVPWTYRVDHLPRATRIDQRWSALFFEIKRRWGATNNGACAADVIATYVATGVKP